MNKYDPNLAINISKEEASNSVFCFLGEFGYEMISWIPYLLYLKQELNIKLTTVSRKGSRTFYYFSDEHIEVDQSLIGDMWGNPNHYALFQEKLLPKKLIHPGPDFINRRNIIIEGIEWTNKNIHTIINTRNYSIPVYSNINDELPFKIKKPYVVINNKFFRQWFNKYQAPINYFDREDLQELKTLLHSYGFSIVYNHFVEQTSSDQFSTLDDENIFGNDSSSICLNNYYSKISIEERNRLQLSVYNSAEFVIGPQGGNLYLPSLCRKNLWMLMRDGEYLDYLEFGRLYGIQINSFYEPIHMMASIKQMMEEKRDFENTQKAIQVVHAAYLGFDPKNDKIPKPFFSICIPTYNRANFIKKTIESVLSQTYKNFEIIIIDDGSTDNTEEVLKEYITNEVRYIKKAHTNAPDSRNLAIEKARGKYLIWIGSDDTITPTLLEIYYKYLTNDISIDILYCQLQSHDLQGNLRLKYEYNDWMNKNNEMLNFLLDGSPIPDGGTAIRKSIFYEVGGYNPQFIRAHDYEFWTRVVAAQKYKAKHIPEVLYYYLIHDKNITMNQSGRIDFSFEARILKSVIKNNGLSRFLNNETSASSVINLLLKIGLKFYSYNDLQEASNYFIQALIQSPSINNLKEVIKNYTGRGEYKLAKEIVYIIQPHFEKHGLNINSIKSLLNDSNETKSISPITTEIPKKYLGDKKFETLKEADYHHIWKLYNKNKINSEPIDIIFLTHNRLKYFAETIYSLYKNTRWTFRVIIVDNNSNKDFLDFLDVTSYLYEKVILNPQNEYTAAFQKGIDVSTSDPFIVSDPDILVPYYDGKCWLEKLVDLHIKYPEMGMIALNLDKSNLPPKMPDVYLSDKQIFNREIILSNVGTVMQAIKRSYFNFKYVTDWETCEGIRNNKGLVGFAKNICGYHLGWNEEIDFPDYIVKKYKYYKINYGVDTYKLYTNNKIVLDKMNRSVEKSSKKSSIIILTHNCLHYTKELIASIESNTPQDYEMVIVDNASNDGTISFLENLRKNCSGIKIILNKENKGFPEGVNQGLTAAEGNYLILINNDVVVTKCWLERMIEIAESNPQIGIVGPISNFVSGPQLDTEAKYKTIEEMPQYAQKVAEKNKNKILEFPRVAFLCTLIKKEVIEKLGGLDERFSPGNFEDDDFCLRAQLAGFKTVIAKDIFIHHYGSKSFKAAGEQKYLERLNINKQKFVEKWGADPEEIWLKGKTFKKQNVFIPIQNKSSSKNTYSELENHIIDLINKNQMQDAIDLADCFFSENQKIIQKLAKTEVLKGIAFLKLNKVSNAKSSFEKALNINSESSEACTGLAELFLIEENLQAAKTMFEWAVKLDPQNTIASERLRQIENSNSSAENENGLKDFAESISSEDEQNALQKTLEEILISVNRLFENKNFNEVISSLIKVENLFYSQPSAKLLSSYESYLGYSYLGLNNLDEAKIHLEKSLEANQESSEACAGLAEIFYLNEMDKEAEVMYEYALQYDSENQFAKLGLEKIYTSLEIKVSEIFEQEELQMSGSLNELMDNIYVLYKRKKFKEVLAVLTYAQHIADDNNIESASSLENLKGYSLLGLNELDEARECFEQALQSNPESSQACAGLAEIFFLNGMHNESKTMYEWAVKNDSLNNFAMNGLTKVNAALGLENNHNSLFSLN